MVDEEDEALFCSPGKMLKFDAGLLPPDAQSKRIKVFWKRRVEAVTF